MDARSEYRVIIENHFSADRMRLAESALEDSVHRECTLKYYQREYTYIIYRNNLLQVSSHC